MFKQSRRKIVAAIMSILVLLWVGTLGVIYASSYLEMKQQNKRMLQTHAQMYKLPQFSGNTMPPEKPRPEENRERNPGVDPNSPMFRLSTFYTVAVSKSGEILEIQNTPQAVYSDGELEQMALKIIRSEAVTGTENNLVFYATDKGGYTLVSFMDNTVFNQRAVTLFRYTLIFGGVALVLFFFLSVFLARKIVNPLEASYRKQKQFISDAGHELKTPISVVSANAELLSREIGDNRWLQNIQYENQRMGLLVSQLLELARTEDTVCPTERIDLSRLVAGEALPFESVAFEKGLVLHTNIAEEIAVMGNSHQLKQLTSILLDNAIRHSQGGTDVSLTLRKEHGYATLCVVNPGAEIPAYQRQQIFERFYRLDSVRNSDDNHYGLGLSIAKAIVTAHQGHIEVLCHKGLVEFRIQIPVF
jgi:signal transduction histidine kinase